MSSLKKTDNRKPEFSRHCNPRICDSIFLYNLNITYQIYDNKINYISAFVILEKSEGGKNAGCSCHLDLICLSKLEGVSCAWANLATCVTASWKSIQSYYRNTSSVHFDKKWLPEPWASAAEAWWNVQSSVFTFSAGSESQRDGQFLLLLKCVLHCKPSQYEKYRTEPGYGLYCGCCFHSSPSWKFYLMVTTLLT